MGNSPGNLFGISDLHVTYQENRNIVEQLLPRSDSDWLIVAGDVGEFIADIAWTLSVLADRFAKVIWVPGNHELWTPRRDPVQLRGEERYRHLVEVCRGLGIVTPEDDYPVWTGPNGPVTIAPLFLLYDYTFRAPGTSTKEESLAAAHASGVVCADEHFLYPDPYPTRDAWCHARLEYSERRLAEVASPDTPTVMINHWPLLQEHTAILHYPEFAQWCGTVHTADWHTRFNAAAVVYGHLHIPRVTWHDNTMFSEVSVGYPREWQWRVPQEGWLRRVLPTHRPAANLVSRASR